MKRALLCVCCAAGAVAAELPLTLDPAVMDEAKRAVFGADPVQGESAQPASAAQGDADRWQRAMDAAGTELMPVLLLALLQHLNPDKPMDAYAPLYAEALRLHVLAAAGNKYARMQLAAALRVGMLPNGLRLICAPELLSPIGL